MCLLFLGTPNIIFQSYAGAPGFAPAIGFPQGAGKFLFSKNVVFAFGADDLSEYHLCSQQIVFKYSSQNTMLIWVILILFLILFSKITFCNKKHMLM